jgi:hypothetical protein
MLYNMAMLHCQIRQVNSLMDDPENSGFGQLGICRGSDADVLGENLIVSLAEGPSAKHRPHGDKAGTLKREDAGRSWR